MAPTTSFCVVASETKRIINAHGRHFRGLFFCLLNFSFSLIIYKYPTAANLSLLPLALRLALSLFAILFSLFAFLFSLSAFSTVTYSTYHGFCGRPDKLAASFKLVSPTLLPLVSTTIATQVLMFLVCASFGLFLVVVTKGAEILGFEIDYNSNYYLGFCIAVFVILVLVLVYLQVNWVLASAIVVLESKWGFEALRRSVYLVKGMRSVSLSLMLLLGSVTGLFLWVHSRITSLSLRSYPDVWESLGFVLLNLVESGFVSLIMLYNVASNTVLYMYCKALHGELALEIPEEYVSLPLDDANLPRVVLGMATEK